MSDQTSEWTVPDDEPDGFVDSGPLAPASTAGVTEPVIVQAQGVNHLAGALIALVVGAGLAILTDVSATALLIGVAGAQAVLIVAWVLGSGVPGRIGALLIGGLAAAGADVAVAHWPHGQLGTLLAVMALAIPVMFVHQLTRGVVRTRVVESLSDIALLVVTVVALAALVQLRHESGGELMASAVILAGAGALVVGHLVDMIWAGPRFDPAVSRGLLAVLVGVCFGAAAGYLRLHNTIEFSSGRAVFVGGAIGAVAGLFAVGTGFAEQTASGPSGTARKLRPASGVLIPLGLLAPVAYLLCLAVRG